MALCYRRKCVFIYESDTREQIFLLSIPKYVMFSANDFYEEQVVFCVLIQLYSILNDLMM